MIAKRKSSETFSLYLHGYLGLLNHPSIRAMMRTITFDLGS